MAIISWRWGSASALGVQHIVARARQRHRLGSRAASLVDPPLAVEPCLRLKRPAFVKIAEAIGTERAAHRIVGELTDAGYASRQRVGRRDHYSVQAQLPIPDPRARRRRVGELLAILAARSRTARERVATRSPSCGRAARQLDVAGAGGEVVAKLMRAAANTGGWCELEQVLSDDRRRAVYANAHAVRWVVEEDEARA
jgi:hypothetical protein